MVMFIVAFFSAFTIAGAIAVATLRFSPALWVSVAASWGSAAIYGVLLEWIPFTGLLSEALITLAAGGVLSWHVRLAMQSADLKRPDGQTDAGKLLLVGCAFPVLGLTFLTLGSRLDTSEQLSWQCDGSITEVARATGNHNLPFIVANCGGSSERFLAVDEPFFAAAKSGQHIVKIWGSPTATLDGRPLRMVH